MKLGRTFSGVFALLFLTSCSSTFIYNQLDWLIPWYVDDYVDLTGPQKKSLKQQLQPLLHWHRKEELARYLDLLAGIEEDLAAPLDGSTLQGWVDAASLAGERLEQHMLPLAFEVGEQLSDAQMADFLESLWDKQAELEEEFLERDDAAYIEESYENFEENLREFLGRLNAEQKLLVQEAAASLQRFDDAWLAERRAWLELLQRVLSERRDDWQQQIVDAMADRQQMQSPQYRDIYLRNQQIILQAVADVLNSRTEKQSTHLQEELDQLRRSLQKLIALAD
jgi:Family of unknown function (DUF6279)